MIVVHENKYHHRVQRETSCKKIYTLLHFYSQTNELQTDISNLSYLRSFSFFVEWRWRGRGRGVCNDLAVELFNLET